MIQEAIVLAGGFGTRLSHVVSDLPKPMAPVAGRPFLEYLLDDLLRQGIRHVVLSTGHLHEKIESHFGTHYRSLALSYAYEAVPLGTGGGILNALRHCHEETVAVLNGDTLFRIDLARLAAFHGERHALLSLALRQVDDTARYGRVQITAVGRIEAFLEKAATQGPGLINGGIYLLSQQLFATCGIADTGNQLYKSNTAIGESGSTIHDSDASRCEKYPPKFSFEKELMEKYVQQHPFYALAFDSYFIDIGVPDDYYRAQQEFLHL